FNLEQRVRRVWRDGDAEAACKAGGERKPVEIERAALPGGQFDHSTLGLRRQIGRQFLILERRPGRISVAVNCERVEPLNFFERQPRAQIKTRFQRQSALPDFLVMKEQRRVKHVLSLELVLRVERDDGRSGFEDALMERMVNAEAP